MYCQQCGAPVFANDKYCRNCGFVVKGYTTKARALQPQSSQPQKKSLKWYHYFLIVIGALMVIECIYDIFQPAQKYINKSFYSERYEVDEMVWLKTPDSTVFSRIGYYEANEILGVTFRKAGSTYYYQDFPLYEWEEFLNADSLSDYYNDYIKGQYDSSKGDY